MTTPSSPRSWRSSQCCQKKENEGLYVWQLEATKEFDIALEYFLLVREPFHITNVLLYAAKFLRIGFRGSSALAYFVNFGIEVLNQLVSLCLIAHNYIRESSFIYVPKLSNGSGPPGTHDRGEVEGNKSSTIVGEDRGIKQKPTQAPLYHTHLILSGKTSHTFSPQAWFFDGPSWEKELQVRTLEKFINTRTALSTIVGFLSFTCWTTTQHLPI